MALWLRGVFDTGLTSGRMLGRNKLGIIPESVHSRTVAWSTALKYITEVCFDSVAFVI